MLVRRWHRNVNLLRPRTLCVLGPLLHLLILLLLLFGSLMRMPERNYRRTFLDAVFIWNVESFWWTSSTLTYPMSFIVEVGSHYVTSRSLILPCWSRSFTPTCMELILQYLSFILTFEVRALLSHPSLLRMCSMFWGLSILTTADVIVWGLCPKMRWSLLSASALLIGVTVNLHHVRPLLKVLDS